MKNIEKHQSKWQNVIRTKMNGNSNDEKSGKNG